MDYVYVVYYSEQTTSILKQYAQGVTGADDDDIVGDIVELIAAYQYEEDARAYIERERGFDPRLAQYLRIEKVIFRV